MSKLKSAQSVCMMFLLIAGLINCNFDSRENKHKLYIVEIKQMQFQPALLKVHSGDTVMWVNHDFVAHDVTEQNTKAWNSSPLAPGAAWRMIAATSADYYCSIHQVMKGKLEVEQ